MGLCVWLCGIHTSTPLNEKSLLCGPDLSTRSLQIGRQEGFHLTPRRYCRSWARCAHYSCRQGGSEVDSRPWLYLTWQISSVQAGRNASCYERPCSGNLTSVMAQGRSFGVSRLYLNGWMGSQGLNATSASTSGPRGILASRGKVG